MYGHVRDGFPYLTVVLPGLNGVLHVECLLDTGFDGELVLPFDIIRQLDCTYAGEREITLADRTLREVDTYDVRISWLGEERLVEAILLDGRPLVGGKLLEDTLIQIEMRDGGEVSVEPL